MESVLAIDTSFLITQPYAHVSVDTTKNNVAIYLPKLGSPFEKNMVIEKTALGENNISLICHEGAHIDGDHIYVFGRGPGGATVMLMHDGENWFVV